MKKFEENLAHLEELTEEIQNGDISLDEAVQLFEEGIKLARKLEKELYRVERKIEILINDPVKASDQPELELFKQQGEE